MERHNVEIKKCINIKIIEFPLKTFDENRRDQRLKAIKLNYSDGEFLFGQNLSFKEIQFILDDIEKFALDHSININIDRN